MKTAIITLCDQGAEVARHLAKELGDCRIYVHDCVTPLDGEINFPAVVRLTADIFTDYRQLVFVGPCGVAVRAIAPRVCHKLTDPAVVIVDVGARWAVSLLSGHEGGANRLAVDIGNALDAEPVISTTTDAEKNLIIGIGCRRGTPATILLAAIAEGLKMADATIEQVRYLASVKLKSDEPGLIEAGRELGIPIRFISNHEILNTPKSFKSSSFVTNKVNLPAVSEPSALLAGRKTSLILCKTIIKGATISIARENCLS